LGLGGEKGGWREGRGEKRERERETRNSCIVLSIIMIDNSG